MQRNRQDLPAVLHEPMQLGGHPHLREINGNPPRRQSYLPGTADKGCVYCGCAGAGEEVDEDTFTLMFWT